jgi:hypothetical protein
MKISSLLLILLSINLVACLGEEASAPLEIPNSPNSDLIYCTDNPINTEALQSNYQIVYDDCIVWNGNTGTAVVRYLSNSSETVGLGVRVHFDSDSMKLTDVYDVLTSDVIIIYPENDDVSIDSLIKPDSDDVNDGDAITDSHVIFAWASVAGDWPGMENADLVTLTFEKVDNGNENYFLNYTSSANAEGYQFNP